MHGNRYRGGLLVLGLLLLVGCGGKGKTPAKPSPTASGGAGFPVTLTDAQKVTVTVPRRPERIVSVSPTVTEMLFAIGAGDRVVAVTEQCNYPPEVKRLAKIGGWFSPSAERAVGRRPDLVIGQRGNSPEFVGTVRKAGCTVFTIAPATLDDIYRNLREIGRLVGEEAGAEKVVAQMQARLAEVKRRVSAVPASRRAKAFIVIQVSPVWTAGRGTFQDDAIRAAGASNVGRSVDGFREFSNESLLAANPDFLLASTMEGAAMRMKRDIESNPVLNQLRAVRAGRVIVLDGDEVMRPGPRVVNAVEAMARGFYPEQFAASPSSDRTKAR